MNENETTKTKDTVELYIDYVTTQLSKLEKYTNLIEDTSINFYEINKALASNLLVANVLNSEYQRLKMNHLKLKKLYECWYDEKYVSIRNLHNSNDLTASKWLSAKEIDCLVKVTYKDDYVERSERVEALELRVSFIRRLMDNWNSYTYALSKLSDNLKTEYFGEMKSNNDLPTRQPVKRI